MWISKKKLDALEKRVADLERKVQDQPKEIIDIISQQMTQRYAKSGHSGHRHSKNQFCGQV